MKTLLPHIGVLVILKLEDTAATYWGAHDTLARVYIYTFFGRNIDTFYEHALAGRAMYYYLAR